MTKLEKDVLRNIVKSMEHPIGGTTAAYGYKPGEVELVTHQEVIRRLDSEDYKLGWREAHRRLKELIEFALTGNAEDLKRYGR
jgi:hypothetical protein